MTVSPISHEKKRKRKRKELKQNANQIERKKKGVCYGSEGKISHFIILLCLHKLFYGDPPSYTFI